jgi:transposase
VWYIYCVTEDREKMEARRKRAALDIKRGMSAFYIAEKYGVSRQSAHRWLNRVKRGASLESTSATGRPCRLNQKQREKLVAVCKVNPDWGYSQVQEWINTEYGIRYNRDHVGRLLSSVGVYNRQRKGGRSHGYRSGNV